MRFSSLQKVSMALRLDVTFKTSRFHKVLFVALLLSVCARIFTGAPEAQVNFLGLLFDGDTSQALVKEVPHDAMTLYGPIALGDQSASRIPPKSADYKMYKKYLPPENYSQVIKNFKFTAQQLVVSILATSYYIKDLTLKSLHSNSPPIPASTLLFIVFMYLFIVRIGVFGNYGEIKNIRDRRFSLQ
jgi:hypothetical protein